MTELRLLILEDAHHQIPDRASRADFLEAVNAYNAGSLRSSIVMLWAALVCDLVRKMRTLRDTYSDPAASEILAQMSALQKANPRSSEWELLLVEAVQTKTNLLSLPEKDELVEIQRKRHLCAHPVIDNADLLYRPTPELVRALLRAAFDAVLSKSPMLSKAIFNDMMAEIEQMNRPGLSGEEFKRFIRARYCSHLGQTVSLQVFRSLWSVTFRSKDDQAEANREFNQLAVEAFFEHSPSHFMRDIKDRGTHYWRTSSGTPAAQLATFVNRAPDLWSLISEDARLLITAEARHNLNIWCLSFYLSETTEKHLDAVAKALEKSPGSSPIRPGVWNLLLKNYSADPVSLERALAIGSDHYKRATSFNAADEIFRFLVRPSLPYHSVKSLHDLLSAIEGNSQCYDRGLAREHHKLVQDRAAELGIDTSTYENFTRTRGK